MGVKQAKNKKKKVRKMKETPAQVREKSLLRQGSKTKTVHPYESVSYAAFSMLKHPKMVIYSSHDTQLMVLLNWLNADNYEPKQVPFASFITIELY